MRVLVNFMILCGIIIMVSNIYRYICFMKSMTDVMSTGKKKDDILQKVALLLLIFFLIGYILIALFSTKNILIGCILFGGSIFVAIALKLLFDLIVTVKERSLEISEVLIGIIDTRDPNLNGHSIYVQNLTMLIYKYLPFEMKDHINQVSLEYAALMHDIGKLGIPESILNKCDKLNEEEWKFMKKHPQIAIQILKPLKNFSVISEWILYHHERMDGKGYYSIPGEQIPLAARIIAVADTYSAITMRRSYKEPQSHEKAISIIKECAGTQFDKVIVKIFCSIPKEEIVSCAPKTVDIRVRY